MKDLFWFAGNYFIGVLVVGFFCLQALEETSDSPDEYNAIIMWIGILAFPVGWCICKVIDNWDWIWRNMW